MTFPFRHLYITAHWTVSGGSNEEGQFGLRTTSQELPSAGEMTNIVTHIQTFWGLAANAISNSFVLDEVKFALVEPNGRYPADFLPEVRTIAPGVPGGASGGDRLPLQTSCVASLRTAALRGRASKGRIYLPPLQSTLNASFQWSGAPWTARAVGVAQMIGLINDNLGLNRVAILSRVGTGSFNYVTSVGVGSRPDVQRRRARGQVETYTSSPVT